MDRIDNSWHEAEQGYRAFLLRCWQERALKTGGGPDECFVWRFALVPINNDQQVMGFGCLLDLLTFLNEEFKGTGKDVLQGFPQLP
jgi:hypothetical protein